MRVHTEQNAYRIRFRFDGTFGVELEIPKDCTYYEKGLVLEHYINKYEERNIKENYTRRPIFILNEGFYSYIKPLSRACIHTLDNL